MSKPSKEPKARAQRATPGTIVEVPLEGPWHGYARVLDSASLAFYDVRTKDDLAPEAILGRPVLFVLAVYKHAVSKGRWRVVGRSPLEPALHKSPPQFLQDELDPRKFEIYQDGQMRPATRAECSGLERCAVWEPEHVEERLRDHYAGRPNQWLESLKMK